MMRQYRQWLFYREIDQRLRGQLEALEAELAKLQAEALSAEQLHLPTENAIFRALAQSLNGQVSPESTSTIENIRNGDHVSPLSLQREQQAPISATLSPTLVARAGLPNFVPPEMQPSSSEVPLSPPSYPEFELLPEDIQSVFDEHGQTDPQLEIPRWLRKIVVSSNISLPEGPIDPESARTNRLVQRWLERWGRQPTDSTQQPRSDEDLSNA